MAEICIIIPAFNEEENIANVILSLKKANPNWKILVVNDGSSDNTATRAKETGLATVISLPCNLGIGGAVQTGFKYAYRNHFQIAIQFDGDGQHIATEIPKLIAPILSSKADVVIGSRFINKNGFQSTFWRRIGIRFFEILNRLLIKQRITDSTSGFRAYNKKSLQLLCQYYPVDYPEPEALVLLGKNKFKITEVPVLMQERQGGISSISGFGSFYYMIKVITAMIIASIRPPLSSRTHDD